MSFAPTFGSVGDFIAISILIKDVVTALDDTKGSASEYHQLIRELLSLERAFLEVGMLCQTIDPSPELVAISIQIRRITDQCKACLEEFLGPIYEYTSAFRPGGSGNKLRDGLRKIRWRFEKDRIMKFRNEITTYGMAIAILVQTANTKLLRLNYSAQKENTLRIHGSNLAQSQQQNRALEEVKAMLNENQDQLAHNQTSLSRMSDKIDHLQATSIDIRPLFSMLIFVIIQGFQTLLKAYSGVPREFDPCFTQKPVIFTDAHGRVHRIHLEWCNSWDSFEATLIGHFRNVPGRKKILQKEYACQDKIFKIQLHRDRPYEESFRPGRVIDMSMTFVRKGLTSVCPACQLEIDQSMDTEIQCPRCQTTFQRVKELVENPPLYINSGTSTTPDIEMIEMTDGQDIAKLDFEMDARVQGDDQESRDNRKDFAPDTTIATSIEDDPRNYTRVRLRQLIPSSKRSVGIQCGVSYTSRWVHGPKYISGSIGTQCDDLPYESPDMSEDGKSEAEYEEG